MEWSVIRVFRVERDLAIVGHVAVKLPEDAAAAHDAIMVAAGNDAVQRWGPMAVLRGYHDAAEMESLQTPLQTVALTRADRLEAVAAAAHGILSDYRAAVEELEAGVRGGTDEHAETSRMLLTHLEEALGWVDWNKGKR
jgi:hypothetical protein